MKSPREELEAVLLHLKLEPGQWFLGGSAGLALRDIRRVGDVDIGVSTRYWCHLADEGGWDMVSPHPNDERRKCDPPYLATEFERASGGTVEVNVFHSWRRRAADETIYNDYNEVFKDGIEDVHGWPCLRLPILLRQKIDAITGDLLFIGCQPREKDITDVGLILDAIKRGD